tara:strand:- start:3219 stop:4043 length:825 start_codon:yes stop_codon:yes gene_type:complete
MRKYLTVLLLCFSEAYKVDEYIDNLDCTIDVIDSVPENLTPDGEPFIFRRGVNHLKKIQQELSIHNLKTVHGQKNIGLDYPGPMASPTPAWRSTTLEYYIQEYINKLDKFDIYDAFDSDITRAYLWGPTDSCDRHRSNCTKNHITEFVPESAYEMYTCPWMDDDKDSVVWGMGGKFTGLPFHNHRWVSNEIVYGKKIWFLYEPEHNIDAQNFTSIDMIFTMIEEYIDDETFIPPKMCILNEGDVINIPSRWNHMSFNLETTVMVACVYEPQSAL